MCRNFQKQAASYEHEVRIAFIIFYEIYTFKEWHRSWILNQSNGYNLGPNSPAS